MRRPGLSTERIGILLVNSGTPEAPRPAAVRAFLARVPRNLPLDSPLPVQCGNGMPLLEAIEQRAHNQGIEVDSQPVDFQNKSAEFLEASPFVNDRQKPPELPR